MKTLTLSLLLFSLLNLSACDDKDDDANNSLKGSWTLVKLTGTIAGIENNYPAGKIKWTFDESKVTVVNNDTEHEYDALETGNYNYEIHQAEVAAECTETISINENDMGCYYFYNNELYINHLANDGVLLKLIKL